MTQGVSECWTFSAVQKSHKLLDHLGPEPLEEWTGKDLYDKLQKRKSAVKICILDQKVVVGVGNIYACEALNQQNFANRMANKVTKKECDNLVAEIKEILAEAIRVGGSSLRDFADVLMAHSVTSFTNSKSMIRKAKTANVAVN